MGALNPLDWAAVAMREEQPERAWDRFFAELNANGFENCSATVMKVGEYVLTDKSHGVVITKAFEEHVRDHPEMTRSMDLLVQFGKHDRVVSCTEGHGEFALWSASDMDFYNRMRDFGYRGGFGASILDPLTNEFTIMTASCFTSERDAIEAYDRIAGEFLPAAIFLQESLRVRDLARDDDFQPLSARERECLMWVCNGLMNSAIAQRTGLSEYTVQEYLRNACRKLQARTRAQAAARATMLQLIDP